MKIHLPMERGKSSELLAFWKPKLGPSVFCSDLQVWSLSVIHVNVWSLVMLLGGFQKFLLVVCGGCFVITVVRHVRQVKPYFFVVYGSVKY